ncbi:MAG: glycogen synthase [Thermodesulfobacteria bacterium]|nr:glycogen synthase [Thermodesulfobacteriota bacterium]
MEIEKVAVLAREYAGIAGAGGVKDVTKGLCKALVKKGIDTHVILPRYGFLDAEGLGFERLGISFSVDMNYASEERTEQVGFWQGDVDGVRCYLVEADRFSEKRGIYTYTLEEERQDPSKRHGEGHFDYFAMNVLHQKASLGLLQALDIRPDVIHCHDGHTGIVPAFIREMDGFRHFFLKAATLLTIHNAGIGYHQEVGDLPFAKAITGLPWRVIYHCLLNGMFDPLIAGASYGLVNTVSENYARELQETELDALTGWLGHALKDRGIKLLGITNGIDPQEYNPLESERLGIPCSFDSLGGDFSGKQTCKKALLRLLAAGDAAVEFLDGRFKEVSVTGSLEYRPDLPLFTVVGRLTEQKGMDILARALEGDVARNSAFNIAILGSGKADIEERLKWVSGLPHNQGRMCVLTGFNRFLANQMYAGGDFFLIPSRFEPCGLTDFIAQIMGNIPIVRRTGGLVKVQDGVNGLSFSSEDPGELASVMARAIAIFNESPGTLEAMRQRAVEIILEKYTWDKVSERYLELYEQGLQAVRGAGEE